MVSEVKAKKKSAFSCEECRDRKVKCPGEQPSCGRCLAHHRLCEYKLLPTLSYTQRLEARVEELEKRLPQSQEPLRYHVTGSAGPNTTAGDESLSLQSHLPLVKTVIPKVRFDARGSISYSSSTSFLDGPAAGQTDDTGVEQPVVLVQPLWDEPQRRQQLVYNAWQQRSLEILAETPEPFQFMLNSHWCWIQPLFNFIYRPAFTRDMQRLGVYYSHTLLNAVLAHSLRWCRNEPQIRPLLEPYDDGMLFSRHARTLLFDEISQGRCSIPTVQTLLLLSAQECGAGNRTQAWLYSGAAFRLIEDMGICIDSEKYATTVGLSDEDIEIRNRLFWSCYFWDKMISLYLGRLPALHHTRVSPPQLILDDSAEEEPWAPHGLIYPPGAEYTPVPARSTSCFMQMCSLSVILNQILLHFYNPQEAKSEDELKVCLDQQSTALRSWWENLPTHLRLDAMRLPQLAPPSHIVTLNCLFHSFKILLYRPVLFSALSQQSTTSTATQSLKECVASASSILAVFHLFRRTFGDSRVVLSLAYSIYTASSIFLLNIQAAPEPDEFSLRRMAFCVRALSRFQQSTPVIGDALSVISRSLSKAGIDISALTDLASTEEFASQDPIMDELSAHPKTDSLSPMEILDTFSTPLSGISFSEIQVDSDTLNAFSSLEPIAATVGALPDAS